MGSGRSINAVYCLMFVRGDLHEGKIALFSSDSEHCLSCGIGTGKGTVSAKQA